jgi:hypothetical protein
MPRQQEESLGRRWKTLQEPGRVQQNLRTSIKIQYLVLLLMELRHNGIIGIGQKPLRAKVIFYDFGPLQMRCMGLIDWSSFTIPSDG